MKKHPANERLGITRFISLISVSVAIPAALVIYSHLFSKPVATNVSRANQEAGQTSIANNELFSNGGILQKNLIGNEKPQEYIRLQTTPKGHAFFPSEVTVHSGEIVSITLENHGKKSASENWVLLKPGTTQEIKEGIRNEPKSWNWIPKDPNVLAFVPNTEYFVRLNNRAITLMFALLRTSAPRPMGYCT
jgi:hypothetical protein